MKRSSARKVDEPWPEKSPSRLDVFERSLQKAGAWLDEPMARLAWEDRHQTWEALGVVLQVLRDRLPLKESVRLADRLPLLLRGLYYQNWSVSGVPENYRHAREFLSRVRGGLLDHRLKFIPEERLVMGVCNLLQARLGYSELRGIRRVLPPELRDFFAARGSEDSGERWLPEDFPWDQYPL